MNLHDSLHNDEDSNENQNFLETLNAQLKRELIRVTLFGLLS